MRGWGPGYIPTREQSVEHFMNRVWAKTLQVSGILGARGQVEVWRRSFEAAAHFSGKERPD